MEFKQQCLNTEIKFKIKIEKELELEEFKYEIEYLEERQDVEIEETKKSDVIVHQFESKKPQIIKEVKKEEIPKIIRCNRCKTLFNNLLESLLHHKHKCKELYQCKKCPKIFVRKDLCEKHDKQAHPDVNPNQCELCSKVFKTSTSLKCHTKYVHLKERKQFCDICGKGFIDITGLRVHKESHKPKGEVRLYKNRKLFEQKESSRICEICGLHFPNYRSHYAHLRMKHSETCKTPYAPKRLKCSLCKVTCESYAKMEQHSRVHTDERPYKCTQCSSAFKMLNHLKVHIKSIHLGEKRYKCPICEKELNDRGNYEVHLRKHNGIKPFACHYCSECFYGPRLLKKHTQKHHPEEKDEEEKL